VQQSSAAASLPEEVVCEVSGLCKQLVLHSARLSSSSSSSVGGVLAAGDGVEQVQPAELYSKPADGSASASAEAAAVAETNRSIWGWLGAELQLVLESRVLGQGLPARRLLDVTEHAAISTDMDAVEPDAWLRRGRQLLDGTTRVMDE
jgi:hypothetical protein